MRDSLKSGDKQNLRIEFDKIFKDEIDLLLQKDFDIYKELNDNKDFAQRISQAIFDMICA